MAYRVHLEDVGQWSLAAGAIIEDALVYPLGDWFYIQCIYEE